MSKAKQKKTTVKVAKKQPPKVNPQPTNPYEEQPCDCVDCDPPREGVKSLTTARAPEILGMPDLSECRKEVFRHQVAIKNAQLELDELYASLETWKQFYNRQIDEDRSTTMGWKTSSPCGQTSIN